MKKLRTIFALILIATATVSLSSLLLPKPADAAISEFYSPGATSVVLVDVMLALGSALLFLIALRNFKPELKPAYRLLAFSTVAVGLGLLLFPYIEYYGLWDNIWFNVTSYLQYLIGAPLMYFGIRKFYRQVGLSGWLAAPLAVLIGIAILSAIHPFLPYDHTWPFPDWGYNLFKIVTIVPIVTYAITTYMAFRLRQRTGQEYKPAFTWLSIGLAFYVINTLGIMLIEVIGFQNVYYDDRLYTIPAILGDMGLLLAGYCFAAIGRPRVSRNALGEPVTSMDIIVFVSGMVSDRRKIDDYLDDMRLVTSQLKPGQALSSDQQKVLRDVYLKIEQFLVSGDSLRTFTKEQLRTDVVRHFDLNTQDSATFWASL